jgi:hypothetical protein
MCLRLGLVVPLLCLMLCLLLRVLLHCLMRLLGCRMLPWRHESFLLVVGRELPLQCLDPALLQMRQIPAMFK